MLPLRPLKPPASYLPGNLSPRIFMTPVINRIPARGLYIALAAKNWQWRQKILILKQEEVGYLQRTGWCYNRTNCRTISNLLLRFKPSGALENIFRIGRKKNTSAPADRVLLRIVRNIRRQTLNDLSGYNEQKERKFIIYQNCWKEVIWWRIQT